MPNARKLARICKVLSVETRLRIVLMLIDGALCVNAIAGRLHVTPAAVSQHLRILRDAELVTASKRGYYVHYTVNETTLARWKKLIGEILDTGGRRGGGSLTAPTTRPYHSIHRQSHYKKAT